MNTKRNITRFDQKLYRLEHSMAISTEKLMHKKEFWVVLIATLVIVGLVLVAVFTQKPVTGVLTPVQFYPYAP